jgi:hypothetical protein
LAIAFARTTTSGVIPASSSWHPARPREARLDLVGDQQDPVLIADRTERAQERRGRRVVAPFAPHGLDEDRGDQ